MHLRDYQVALVDSINACFKRGARSVCLQLGTGGGKTALASDLLRRAVARGYKAIFIAALDTLVEDTESRLRQAGVPCGFVQAGRPTNADAPVQVCSLQTLFARGERPPADFVILDECHNAQAASVLAVLADYPRARLLGLSATPQRSDGKPLGDIFQELVSGPSNRWLTARGHLVPCDIISAEQYVDNGLFCEPLDAYKTHAPNGRAIVFASNVLHAEAITTSFKEAGIATECITGETSRAVRSGLRDRLQSGETRVLVGVRVFLQGFDAPCIDTVILAAAFGVPGIYLQGIGRGLRPCPSTGKTRCIVLDLKGCVNLHGLPDEDRVWSLTGRACRRTEHMIAVQRCAKCWAIFRPAKRCPRCGAEHESIVSIPRVLSRAERMVRWEGLAQELRDERYLAALVRVANRWASTPAAALEWAERKFRAQFGRDPQRAEKGNAA